jgi:hypothetical protein
MTKLMLRVLAAAAVLALLGVGSYAVAGAGKKVFKEDLRSLEEVPVVSTPAVGSFDAAIAPDDQSIDYTLTYAGVASGVLQAHIHFGPPNNTGGISIWLCSNLASPPTPAGVQACPVNGGTVSGTITAANVVGPAAQGIAAGELAEIIAAMRDGKTYANVHSNTFPAGEIRAQLNDKS